MFLHATLPENEAKELKNIILNSKFIDPITIKELVYELEKNNTNSVYFSPFKQVYKFLFNSYNQTTLNDQGQIIIGNGIDLNANPNMIALFYELNPTLPWKEILDKVGEPNPPLSQKQIDQLLCLSLLGVTNAYGDVKGTLMQLNNQLSSFAMYPFPVNQLVSLSSLVYLRNGDVPKNLNQTVTDMLVNKCDLAPMETIMEYSNDYYDVEVQNQLLRIGAIFHGKFNDTNLDVHLTFRQKERILSKNQTPINIKGGPIKWGIPINENQENTFNGDSKIVIKPSFNPDPSSNDTAIFGTPENDILSDFGRESFNIKESGSVLFGGNGADQLNTTMKWRSFVYLAGNKGKDIYTIDYSGYSESYNTSFMIYDSDHQGKIFIKNIFSNRDIIYPLSGPIIDNLFCFSDGFFSYKVKTIAENDGTTTLLFKNEQDNKIEIPIYQKGQFNILPNVFSYQVADDPPMKGAASQYHVAFIFAYNPQYETNILYIYNLDGTIYSKIQLLEDGSRWETVEIVADIKDNFWVTGVSDRSRELLLMNVNPFTEHVSTEVVDKSECIRGPYSFFPTFAPMDLQNKEIALVYSRFAANCFAQDTYIRFPSGNQILLDTSNMSTATGVGLMNDSYVVTFTKLQGNDENDDTNILQFSNETITKNYTLKDITILSINPLSDGYFVVYCHMPYPRSGYYYYTKIFSAGKWTNEYQLLMKDPYASHRVQPLPNDRTFVFTSQGNYIFDKNNIPQAGPFDLGGTMSRFDPAYPRASTLLKNTNNTFIAYDYEQKNEGYKLRAVIIPTSLINEDVNEHTTLTRRTAIATRKVGNKVTATTYSPNSIFGEWSKNVREDPRTGEPIFTYFAYLNGEVIGSAEFYGQPLLCRSFDGQAINLIKTTGIFDNLDFTETMKIEEICRILPPSFVEKIFMTARETLPYGMMRGVTNVLELSLRSKGVPRTISTLTSELLYHTGFFALRFNSHLQLAENEPTMSNYLSVVYQSLTDTAILMATHFGLYAVDCIINKIGDLLVKKSWVKTGEVCKKTGSILRFGIFALCTGARDMLESSVAIASATLGQVAVEESGSVLVNRFLANK